MFAGFYFGQTYFAGQPLYGTKPAPVAGPAKGWDFPEGEEVGRRIPNERTIDGLRREALLQDDEEEVMQILNLWLRRN